MEIQLPPEGASTAPNFRPMSVVAKRPLGTEVGLGPGDIVLALLRLSSAAMFVVQQDHAASHRAKDAIKVE